MARLLYLTFLEVLCGGQEGSLLDVPKAFKNTKLGLSKSAYLDNLINCLLAF